MLPEDPSGDGRPVIRKTYVTMPVMTPVPSGSASVPSRVPAGGMPPVSAVSLSLAVTMGGVAGLVGILQEAGLFSGLAGRQAGVFHAVAMLLFVTVPALTGGFGRLFLMRDLPGAAGLPRLDLAAMAFILASLLVLLVGNVPAGLLLWSVGAVLLSAGTLALILNSRSGPGCVAVRGSSVQPLKRPFSLFVWTQFFAAAGLILAAPVMAAAMTKTLWGLPDNGEVLRTIVLPLSLVVLVAAAGLATRVFETLAPLGKAERLTGMVSAGLAAAGGAVLWDHNLFVHDTAFSAMSVAGLEAVVSVVFAGLWMKVLWQRKVAAGGVAGLPVLWVSAFFVLLVAGWAVQITGGHGLHEAVLSGTMFVLFGAFYTWLERDAGLHCPARLVQVQFWLLFAGTVLSAGPGVIRLAGDAAMVVSLLVFGAALISAMRTLMAEVSALVAKGEAR